MKTPTPIAVAIYSDFLMRDYSSVLPTITVPTVVFAGASNIFERGIEQGRWVAEQVPGAKFVPSETGGHVLFYEDAKIFNLKLESTLATSPKRNGPPPKTTRATGP